MPRVVGLLVVVLVLLGLLLGIALGARSVLDRFAGDPEDFTGQGSGAVVVQVQPGDSATAIGRTLAESGVVASAGAFTDAASQRPESRGIAPGSYELRSGMSGQAAVELLLDPATRVVGRVTVPEGMTVSQTLQRLADGTGIPLEQLQAAVDAPDALGLPTWAGGQVEGLLFPATYDFEPGTTAAQALTTMVARFAQAANELDLENRSAQLGVEPYDVLRTASLIEKETAFPEDRARVARVVYNRLADGMPLQFDSTVNYLREEPRARLSLEDLEVDSPYNTYQVTGLPPTPIDSPGQAALEAALTPAEGDYVFFVTTATDGSSLFTADYNEFLRAKAKAQADGIY